MSAVPAARYLADFGVDGDARAQHAGGGPVASDAAKLDEAFANGVESGRTATEAEFEVKLEEQRAEFETRLATERQEWAASTGEELANQVLAAVQEFEGRVAETTARILKPFVAAQLHRQAMAELQASLDVLMTADPGVSLSISGPADVLEALQAHLSGKTTAVTYTASDDCDVRILAGPATLETCLKGWMAKLEEAVP
ncbi:MAG: hypothetical protein K2X43_23095 [Hyphomonadaceae bacterium]|jgi:hypothetical protein|nr:hypothetical protein [Hyphomonadaceae bacterium]